jgi:nucleoside-diphosphate-sugar epimerase
LLYVDNLVRSIEAVTRHPAPQSGFYHLADDETLTWRDYYGALADGLGLDMARVHLVAGDRYRLGLRDLLKEVQDSPASSWFMDRLSMETRKALKLRLVRTLGRDRLARMLGRDTAAPVGAEIRPVVTRELWHLQTTRNRLPTTKFGAAFGHRNQDSFASGLAASLAWLRFIGLVEREPVPAWERSEGSRDILGDPVASAPGPAITEPLVVR